MKMFDVLVLNLFLKKTLNTRDSKYENASLSLKKLHSWQRDVVY